MNHYPGYNHNHPPGIQGMAYGGYEDQPGMGLMGNTNLNFPNQQYPNSQGAPMMMPHGGMYPQSSYMAPHSSRYPATYGGYSIDGMNHPSMGAVSGMMPNHPPLMSGYYNSQGHQMPSGYIQNQSPHRMHLPPGHPSSSPAMRGTQHLPNQTVACGQQMVSSNRSPMPGQVPGSAPSGSIHPAHASSQPQHSRSSKTASNSSSQSSVSSFPGHSSPHLAMMPHTQTLPNHSVPQHPMRPGNKQQNPQDVADSILQIASSYPTNQTVQVPLKTRAAPYHIPRSPHYNMSHSQDSTLQSPSSQHSNSQASPVVASSQPSPTPSSSSVKSPTPVLAPIPNPIPSPGISEVRSPCNQGMSPCRPQKSPLHMGTVYYGHSQGVTPYPNQETSTTPRHTPIENQNFHNSQSNLKSGTDFTCSQVTSVPNQTYSTYHSSQSLMHNAGFQLGNTSSQTEMPESGLVSNISLNNSQSQVHTDSSLGSNNSMENSASNPLMSLQKLVMLPETQVVDPKSVVNNACAEQNENEGSKNVDNPAEKLVESSSFSVGFSGLQSSQFDQNIPKIEFTSLKSSESSPQASQESSPSNENTNSRVKLEMSNSKDEGGDLNKKNICRETNIDCKVQDVQDSSNREFKPPDNNLSEKLSSNVSDCSNQDVSNSSPIENEILATGESFSNEFSSAEAVKLENVCITPETDQDSKMNHEDFEEGDIKCPSPMILSETPLLSDGIADLIQEKKIKLYNALKSKSSNGFQNRIQKLRHANRNSSFTRTVPCSLSVGEEGRLPCDRFPFRRNRLHRLRNLVAVRDTGRKRHDSTGNADSDESVDSPDRFVYIGNPQDGNGRKGTNTARRGHSDLSNRNRTTSSTPASDVKSKNSDVKNENGFITSSCASDDEMCYYEGVDNTDIFMHTLSDDSRSSNGENGKSFPLTPPTVNGDGTDIKEDNKIEPGQNKVLSGHSKTPLDTISHESVMKNSDSNGATEETNANCDVIDLTKESPPRDSSSPQKNINISNVSRSGDRVRPLILGKAKISPKPESSSKMVVTLQNTDEIVEILDEDGPSIGESTDSEVKPRKKMQSTSPGAVKSSSKAKLVKSRVVRGKKITKRGVNRRVELRQNRKQDLKDSFKSMKFSRTLKMMKSRQKKEIPLIGPFVRVTGNQSHPKSVSVYNQEPHSSLAMSRGKNSHNASVSTTFHLISNLPGDKVPMVSSAKTISEKNWVCAFCGHYSGYRFLGDLFGPYFREDQIETVDKIASDENRKDKRLEASTTHKTFSTFPRKKKSSPSKNRGKIPEEIWVHEMCALWATGVYMVGNKMYGLEDAIADAHETVCSVCQTSGAMLGCLQKGCSMNFHCLCAVEKGCLLDEENFSLLCPKHKNKKRSAQYAISASVS